MGLTNSKSTLKIGSLKYRLNEIWKMQADNRFITSKGWKPKVNFDNGLKKQLIGTKNFINLI